MKRFNKWIGTKTNHPPIAEVSPEDLESVDLSSALDKNEAMFQDIFKNCSDIVFRKVSYAEQESLVVYLASLSDEQVIDDHILKPLFESDNKQEAESKFSRAASLGKSIISAGSTKLSSQVQEIVHNVLDGYAAVLTDTDSQALLVRANGAKYRSLEEPSSEQVIRGPRDGFIENISTNMGLIRGRLKTVKLKMESVIIGDLTQTQVVMTYIVGIAEDSLIEEVRKRVSRIQIDGVLDSGYIEEFIEDLPSLLDIQHVTVSHEREPYPVLEDISISP